MGDVYQVNIKGSPNIDGLTDQGRIAEIFKGKAVISLGLKEFYVHADNVVGGGRVFFSKEAGPLPNVKQVKKVWNEIKEDTEVDTNNIKSIVVLRGKELGV
jgi:hypothetical protein